MKKQILATLAIALGFGLSYAQLSVSENGNVGIKSPGDAKSPLCINSPGDAIRMIDIRTVDKPTGIYLERTESPSDGGWVSGIHSTSYLAGGTVSFGMIGYAWGEVPMNSGRSIGVCGIAANATDGYNLGVVGSIKKNQKGVGVFGSDDHYYVKEYMDGRYAGYFRGNVKVTGTINGTVVGNSDVRYKQNIVGLGELSSTHASAMNARENRSGYSAGVLNAVLELNPVQYNYKQVYFEPVSDTTTVKRGFFNEESQMFQKKHYGLIAQELQDIYPELVYEEDNGYLSIDYIGLIPLLIQSVKELNAKIALSPSAEKGVN